MKLKKMIEIEINIPDFDPLKCQDDKYECGYYMEYFDSPYCMLFSGHQLDIDKVSCAIRSKRCINEFGMG